MTAPGCDPPVGDSEILIEEIRSLRAELQSLKRPVVQSFVAPPSQKRHVMKVAIDRAVGERKPFTLRVQGVLDFTIKLSTMRAAILLGLMLDLHDRCSAAREHRDPMSRIVEIYRALEEITQEEQIAELVRVGLYRFEVSLIDAPLFQGGALALEYNAQSHRLEIAAGSSIRSLADIALSVSSSDPTLLALIDRLSEISPIDRARAQRSMYISSSEQGWDRLFLEYFDHKLVVKNTSLFYRPALPTYPDELLSFIGASSATVKRKRIMIEGYSSGRISFHETLRRQTLWDMITQMPSGQFKLYPPGIPIGLIERHLEELMRQLSAYSQYQLTLTDAVFPFIVGVVQIGKSELSEYFTMFYRAPQISVEEGATCFVLHDPIVGESVLSRVIDSVTSHPTTTSNRDDVLHELERVRNYLQQFGPMVG